MTDEGSESLTRRNLLRAAAGGAVAASAGVAGAQDETPTDSGDEGGGGYTWTVEMTDENVFVPDQLSVRPGDTVVWENVGTVGHSVTAYGAEIPGEAEYWAAGDVASEEEARNAYPEEGNIEGGESYEHTFEVAGTHEYFCIPHEQLGMVGAIEVDPEAPTPTPTPAAGEPILPPTAKALGVAAAALMASTLGLAYAFLKYGGSGGEG